MRTVGVGHPAPATPPVPTCPCMSMRRGLPLSGAPKRWFSSHWGWIYHGGGERMFLCSGRAIGDPERAIAVRYRAPARLAPARLIQPFDHDMILELNVPDPGEVEDLQRAVLHSDQSLRTCRPRTADRGSSVEVPAGTPQRDGSSWAQCSRPSPPTTVRKGRPAGVHWAGRMALAELISVPRISDNRCAKFVLLTHAGRWA